MVVAKEFFCEAYDVEGYAVKITKIKGHNIYILRVDGRKIGKFPSKRRAKDAFNINLRRNSLPELNKCDTL